MPQDFSRACAFPLYGIVDTAEGPRCGCNNPECGKNAGKHTWIKWGRLGPGEQLAGEEGRDNLAYATGTRSGFFVLDVDGEEGARALAALGPVPDTYTVKTPTSTHYYFALPDFAVKTSGGEIAPCVDVRGEGGLIVAAGSRHRTGGAYECVRDVPIAPAPAWLLAHPALRREVSVSTPGEAGALDLPSKAIDAARALAGAWPKSDHDAKFALAGALVRDFSEDSTIEFLRMVCEEAGADASNVQKMARDAHAGLRDGRTTWGWAHLEKLVGGVAIKARRILGGLEKAESTIAALRPAEPEPLAAPEVEGAIVRRRTRTPGHVYSYTPGDEATYGDPCKLSALEATKLLRTHPDWAGVLSWDVFARRLVCIDPPLRLEAEGEGLTETDAFAVSTWFESQGALVTPTVCFSAALAAAQALPFHPVIEYLEALPESDLDLDEVCARALGNTGPLEGVFLRKWLIACVRRVLEPGCQVDNTLVLVGEDQGEGKTSFGRILGSPWNAEDMPDLSTKDAMSALRGAWIVELAELDKLLRVDAETSKAFLTRRVDRFRPSYGRSEVACPRTAVFYGTTNKPDILRDATGGRRFWPIVTTNVDREWLKANRDRVWRAALDAVRAGEEHWLPDDVERLANAHRNSFEEHDPWHEVLEGACRGKEEVRISELWEKTLRGDVGALGRKEMLRIADTLRRLGCKQRTSNGRRFWTVPKGLREQKPSSTLRVVK